MCTMVLSAGPASSEVKGMGPMAPDFLPGDLAFLVGERSSLSSVSLGPAVVLGFLRPRLLGVTGVLLSIDMYY